MALALTQQVRELRKELDSIKAEALRLADQRKKAPSASAPTATAKPSPATSTPTAAAAAAKPSPAKPAVGGGGVGAGRTFSTPTPTGSTASKPAPTPTGSTASKPTPSAGGGAGRPPASSKPAPAKNDKPSVINVVNADGIRNLVEQVKKGSLDWVVLGYEDNNNKIGLKASGLGGIAQLKQKLAEDQALYAVLRVAAAGTTAVKFVFITWIGPRVPALKKARVSTHRDSVGELFGSCHIRMQTDQLDELSPQSIDAKIRHAAGTDYDRGY